MLSAESAVVARPCASTPPCLVARRLDRQAAVPTRHRTSRTGRTDGFYLLRVDGRGRPFL